MSVIEIKSSKKQRRLERQLLQNELNTGLELKKINPLTHNQDKTFDSFYRGKNLMLHGVPGSGKTFISMYLALDNVLSNKTPHTKLIIIRSAQSSKNIGFLPGNEKQKLEVFEQPYKIICNELFDRGDAYDILKKRGIIEFHSTSFLRGTTIDDAIIIIDEAQNSSYMELKTVFTRVGKNAKLIICGDIYQDDLTSVRYNEESGLLMMLMLLKTMKSIEFVEFEIEDIVRSGFVKEFILAELEMYKKEM